MRGRSRTIADPSKAIVLLHRTTPRYPPSVARENERGSRMQFALTSAQSIEEDAAVRRSERDRLVKEHLPLVRSIAGAVRSSAIGAGIPLDDLVAYGANGLLDAAERFDAGR